MHLMPVQARRSDRCIRGAVQRPSVLARRRRRCSDASRIAVAAVPGKIYGQRGEEEEGEERTHSGRRFSTMKSPCEKHG